MTAALLSYLMLLPAQVLCLLPMCHQLKPGRRKALIFLVVLDAVLFPLAALVTASHKRLTSLPAPSSRIAFSCSGVGQRPNAPSQRRRSFAIASPLSGQSLLFSRAR